MSRTNEELVSAIQAGEDRMAELWAKVDRLVRWKASRIMTTLELRGNPCGVEFDDLYQSGYLALVAAVDSYNPESGAFSTWFMYHLKTAYAEATGYRTKAGQNEPLNNSISLDTPLSDDSDSDMMEVVADPDGQKPTQGVEEAIFHQQLHEAIEKALATLPEQSAEVLRLRHYQGLTLADVGERKGTTAERVRQMENKALRQLRKPSIACHLRPFYDFDFYCGTGFGAFQHSGMSVQERYLVIEEEQQEKAESRRREREQRRQDQKLKADHEAAMEQLESDVNARISSMTPEEKQALLEKYGLA